MATQTIPRLTEDEYLALDRANEFRSEFVDGEMLAMSGSHFLHSALGARLITALVNRLPRRNCVVCNCNMRVRTMASGSYLYPDASVICGKPLFHQDQLGILINPVLVAEVLSPSTENYDKGRKFCLYREIESVKEYLLLHSDSPKIEHYSRQADDSWIFREVSGLESIDLRALSIALDLSCIYADLLS